MTLQTAWDFPAATASALPREVARVFGPLQTGASDPTVTDSFVLSDGRVHADRGHGAAVVTDLRLSHTQSVDLARPLIEYGGHLERVSAQAARMASLGATTGEIRTEVRRQAGSDTTVVVFDGPSGVSRCARVQKDTDLDGLRGVIFPLTAQTCALKAPGSDG